MKKSLIALAVLAASMCLAATASAQPVDPSDGPAVMLQAKAKSSKAKSAKKHKTAFVEMADTGCEAGKKAPPAKPGKTMPGKPGKKCLTT